MLSSAIDESMYRLDERLQRLDLVAQDKHRSKAVFLPLFSLELSRFLIVDNGRSGCFGKELGDAFARRQAEPPVVI